MPPPIKIDYNISLKRRYKKFVLIEEKKVFIFSRGETLKKI